MAQVFEVKHCTSFPRYFVILAIALARLMGTGNALPGGQETGETGWT